jgi:hypothetical protein
MESKVKLTGGTLFVIALIVLILGNARSIEIVEKLDVLTSDVSSLRSEVESYKQQVEILKNKNIILKEQLGSGD